MKKVLITGENSYVGNSFAEWVKDDWEISVEKISLRNGKWREMDFSKFDVVVHVAGIAHQKETNENEHMYYKVNRDMAVEIAEKAKNDGVNHFIFLSSMSVYGIENGLIDENTSLKPLTNYGKSKLEAEEGISDLASSSYNIAILRPPMIYGKNSKGNYSKLAKAARKLPVFPDIKNERSMIHIDNLSEFIRLIIKNNENGLYFPQNDHFVKTSEMVHVIGKVHGKKIRLTKIFNLAIKPLVNKVNILNKIFGSLRYKQEISSYKENYNVSEFIESIEITEKEK